ncbi:serine hydrolase domain-containing protein [Kitasatospora sp. NPDC096147]|uniref:serine hydrolase domain-containing protein n=1 Tax=Kitasatospora sp. NPDC096147 TaxID=3364093 RepID=UPI00380C19B8
MRRTPARRLAAALLTLSALIPVTLAAPPAQAELRPTAQHATTTDAHTRWGEELDPALAARLDEAIERVRQETGTPGVVAGLWLPGRGEYVRTFGVADRQTGEPMDTSMHFRIGSETKTFTVTALLELVDQGLVDLDAPISTYLEGVPCGDEVTIRQMAEMRSGLFSYTFDDDFVHDLLSDPERPFTPQELLGYAFKHDNVFPPGTQFQYSNTNTVLLGLVVEKLGGMPLADFIHEHVTGPAGLERTFLPVGAELPAPYPHGYTDQTLSGQIEDSTHWNPSWGWAAGAMISDLCDLRRWAKVVATGELLSPATQAQREKFLPVPNLDDGGYGLGLFATHGWVGHDGSLPGYESVTMYLPEADATLVVLLNTDVLHEGHEPSGLFAKAITEIATPGHVYTLPSKP